MQESFRRMFRRRKKKYIERPRRSRWPVTVTLLLLTVMLAASVWGVAVIDCSSSMVGWDRRPTEFAVALTPGWDKLRVTVFGRQYGVTLGQGDRVRRAVTQTVHSLPYTRPALWREGELLMRTGVQHMDFVRRAYATLIVEKRGSG